VCKPTRGPHLRAGPASAAERELPGGDPRASGLLC
jgi:hypothetical protein